MTSGTRLGAPVIARLRAFRRRGIHVLGSFIFGLNSDTRDAFILTVALAGQADLTFAPLVRRPKLYTPPPASLEPAID